MEIEIDDTLRSMAERVTENRYDSFEKGVKSHDRYGRDSYDAHYLGALSEVAVSDYYNLLVDLTTRIHGDETDFQIFYKGEPVTVDVKTTTYDPPWLRVRENKVKNDYYISTYVAGREADVVELVGWASAEDVVSAELKDSLSQTSSHRNHRLKPNDLQPLPKPSEISRRKKVEMLQ